MDCVTARAASDVDQLVDAEVTFTRGCRADGISFVGEADVEGSTINLAEDSDGRNAEFAAGSDYADGDFTAIGD
jgi:hypothetical protein